MITTSFRFLLLFFFSLQRILIDSDVSLNQSRNTTTCIQQRQTRDIRLQGTLVNIYRLKKHFKCLDFHIQCDMSFIDPFTCSRLLCILCNYLAVQTSLV